MVMCAIFGCRNNSVRKDNENSKNVGFFRFPRDKKLCKIWNYRCNRSDKFNLNNARICGMHFSDDCFDRNLRAELLNIEKPKRILKQGSLPNKNLPGQKLNTQCQINRKQRYMAKMKKDFVTKTITTALKENPINKTETETEPYVYSKMLNHELCTKSPKENNSLIGFREIKIINSEHEIIKLDKLSMENMYRNFNKCLCTCLCSKCCPTKKEYKTMGTQCNLLQMDNNKETNDEIIYEINDNDDIDLDNRYEVEILFPSPDYANDFKPEILKLEKINTIDAICQNDVKVISQDFQENYIEEHVWINDIIKNENEIVEEIDSEKEDYEIVQEDLNENSNFWLQEKSESESEVDENELFSFSNVKTIFDSEPEFIAEKNGFKCTICEKIIRSRGSYARHLTGHQEWSKLCMICGILTKDHRKLYYHEKYHYVRPKIQTGTNNEYNIRRQLGSRRTEFYKAVRDEWPGKPTECPYCSKIIRAPVKYYDHINSHTKDKPYICSCGSKSSFYENFLFHIRKFNCAVEGRIIPDYAPKVALLTTENIRNKNKKIPKPKPKPVSRKGDYKCHECNIQFHNHVKIREHKERFHMEKKFVCEICKRKFAKNNLLRTHINTSHLKTYKCEVCCKYFTIRAYRLHMRTHHLIKNSKVVTTKIKDKFDLIAKKKLNSEFFCGICLCPEKIIKIPEHYHNNEHVEMEMNWRKKYDIEKYSCESCHEIIFNDIFSFIQHQRYCHKISMANQARNLFKSLETKQSFQYWNTYGNKSKQK